MKKKKKSSLLTRLSALLSLACSGTLMFGGAVLAIGTIIMLKTSQFEGWEGFGQALGGVILMILGIIYAAVGILPCLIKTIGAIKPKIVFPILGFPFDLAYTIMNVVMIVSILSEGVDNGEILGLVIMCAMTLVSLAGMALGVSNVVFIKKDKKRAKMAKLEAATEEAKGAE